MEVQTRNSDGALRFFGTIKEAFDHANDVDKTVWKISWTNESTDERVRLVRRSVEHWGEVIRGRWIYEPIDIDEIFTSQVMTADEMRKMMGLGDPEEGEDDSTQSI